MKKLLFAIFLYFNYYASNAQVPFLPNLENADIFRETGIITGYTYNFGFEEGLSGNHVVELGYKGAYYVDFLLTSSVNYYAATDVNLNFDNFFIGPKIGGYVGFTGLIFGSDLAFYANLNETSLRFIPYGGIGSHAFRLVFAPHVPITNSDFQAANPYNITLSIRLIRLNRERILRDQILNKE